MSRFKNLESFLESLMGNNDKDREVIKKVPVTKKQKDGHDELMRLGKAAAVATQKLESKTRLYWSTVEEDLDDYRNMRYNADTDEIEIFADEFDKQNKKGKSIKSPIQIKL